VDDDAQVRAWSVDFLAAMLVNTAHATVACDSVSRGSHLFHVCIECRYIGNVASNPGEEKFRRIRVSNAAFQSKVASAPHGLEFLEIVGFKVSSVHWHTTSCRLFRSLQWQSCTHVGQT